MKIMNKIKFSRSLILTLIKLLGQIIILYVSFKISLFLGIVILILIMDDKNKIKIIKK